MISYLATHIVRPHQLLLYQFPVRVESENRIVDCPLGHEVAAYLDMASPVLARIRCFAGDWTRYMLFQMTTTNVNIVTAKAIWQGCKNVQLRKDDLWQVSGRHQLLSPLLCLTTTGLPSRRDLRGFSH